MDRKTFTDRMRAHYRASVPETIKIDFASIDVEDQQSVRRPLASFLAFAQRSVLKVAVVGLLATFTAFMLLGRGGTETPVVLAEIDDVYAFQAVSATDLLIQALPDPTPLSFRKMASAPRVATDLEVLNQYLNMMEGFLGNETLLAATIQPSDRPDYQYKLTYDSLDIFGLPVSYVLYYSETAVTDAPAPDYVFTDEDDEHVVSHLVGEMAVGTVVYRLEGKQIVEDGEEKFVWRSYADASNYVLVRYETDDDGQKKFFYSVVAAGVVQNRSKLQVETEDDRIVTKLEFIEGAASGRYTFRETVVDGIRTIDIVYAIDDGVTSESGNVRVRAVTDEVTGATTYAYSVKTDDDDEESNYEYHRHDDEEDDEEDHGEETDEDGDPVTEDPDDQSVTIGSQPEADAMTVSAEVGDDIGSLTEATDAEADEEEETDLGSVTEEADGDDREDDGASDTATDDEEETEPDLGSVTEDTDAEETEDDDESVPEEADRDETEDEGDSVTEDLDDEASGSVTVESRG